MPYYGDYYAGDPGLFGFVKKLGAGIVRSVLPGPARTILDIGSKVLKRRVALGAKPEVQAVGAPMQVMPLGMAKRSAPRSKPDPGGRARRARRRRLKFGSPAWRARYMR